MKYIFTIHAIQRMKQRKIVEEEVIETLKSPDTIKKKENKYYARKDVCRGIMDVEYEKTERYIRIITVYWL